MKPTHIILEGITGSKAYGLDTETSDTDIKGVYVQPTDEVHKLGWNYKHTTKDHTNPDWVYHEVQKFMSLAMDCNPTILEMLFLDDYLVLDPIGQMLVDNRNMFLSSRARKSYYGYAYSQMSDLMKQGYFGSGRKNRYEKHARHTYRLLYQGKELLATGNLTVRVTPEVRTELFAMGELTPNELVQKFKEEHEIFDTLETVLPDKPDIDGINKMLLKIRRENY